MNKQVCTIVILNTLKIQIFNVKCLGYVPMDIKLEMCLGEASQNCSEIDLSNIPLIRIEIFFKFICFEVNRL